MAIQFTLTNSVAGQVNIDDIADAHGYTGFELVLDADGNPAPVLDENGNPVYDENNAIVYQKNQLTKTEFAAKIMMKYLMPVVYSTTSYLERKNGVDNYNKAFFDNLFKETTTVGLVVNANE